MNSQALHNAVAAALADKPTEQPVGYKADDGQKADSEQKNNQKKARGAIAMGYKARQKGNPNKSYSVAAINKAQARIG